MLKQVRTHLIETARPVMEALVQEITGMKVLSMHHDISTSTGEEILVCLLLLPGSALTLAGGFLFGMALGAVTASLGATLGAMAAFVPGRFLVREYIEGGILDHPRFLAIDRAIDGLGFTIVLLTSLCSFFP